MARKKNHLVVTMIKQESIDYKKASDTFVETIEKIGVEDVAALGITVGKRKLIVTSEEVLSFSFRGYRKSGEYWILTGTSNEEKKDSLEDIKNRLEINMRVELQTSD